METQRDSRDAMRAEVDNIYNRLRAVRMHEHARDFWRIRARKQPEQVKSDALVHEHTALTQYMLWHDINGARLPSFQRGTSLCLQQACNTSLVTSMFDGLSVSRGETKEEEEERLVRDLEKEMILQSEQFRTAPEPRKREWFRHMFEKDRLGAAQVARMLVHSFMSDNENEQLQKILTKESGWEQILKDKMSAIKQQALQDQAGSWHFHNQCYKLLFEPFKKRKDYNNWQALTKICNEQSLTFE